MKRNPVMKHTRLSAFCIVIVLTALGALTGSVPIRAAQSPEIAAAAGSRQGFDDIPLLARYAVSKALGRDRKAYHAVKDDGAYHAVEGNGGFRADNPAQSYGLAFSSNGIEVRSGEASLGLRLRSWGYGENQHPVIEAQPISENNLVEYKRGALTEWYVNGPYGLQQGFTLQTPPGQSPPGERPKGAFLRICLERLGGLKADVDQDRRGVVVYGHGGQTLFRYGGLTVIDADGRELKAWLDVDTAGLNISVDDRRARYPLTIDPIFQFAKLTASDGARDDYFGTSVSISGDTIVVGAPFDDGNGLSSGSAYVFVKQGYGWGNMTQTAKLTASDRAEGDKFGTSVSISSDTIVVGAYRDEGDGGYSGSAYVFVEPAGGWEDMNQTAKLTAWDGEGSVYLGTSVSISGDTIVVGAPGADGNDSQSGSAYVFVKPAGGWATTDVFDAKLTASDGAFSDDFGDSVAVSGDTVVVGAVDTDGNDSDSGSAYVFVKPAGGWPVFLNEDAKLTASDGEKGDRFGTSVAVSGDTVVVGAPWDDNDNGRSSGSVYVFVKPVGGWADSIYEDAKLTASDGERSDEFGYSVAVSGDTIVVGARDDDNHGSAYVFVKPGGGWSVSSEENAKLTALDVANGDHFGYSVSISGDTIAVGATGDDSERGSAYAFAPAYALNVSQAGTGSGTVESSPEGIYCPEACYIGFPLGAKVAVTLTAEPDTGSALDGWRGADCPGNGNCSITMGQDYTVTAVFNTDLDGDGISDRIEDDGPNNGDGNLDGFPDSEQQNVTTFQDIYGQWCTLAAPLNLKDVYTTVNPSPADMPAEVDTVVSGFFGFNVRGMAGGATVNVALILHTRNLDLNDFYKYGPTHDDPTNHWYDFRYYGTNGVFAQEDGRTVITLHITDGGLGDDDLTANNSIVCNYLAGVYSLPD